MDILKNGATKALQRHASFWIFLGLSGAIILSSSNTQNFRIRHISNPMIIKTSKIEPPRIAFDEIVNSQRTEKKYSNEWNLLNASTGQSINLNAQKISNKVSALKAIQSRKIVLREMQFSQNVALAEIQQLRQREVDNQTLISGLDTKDRQRVLLAQEKADILDQNWTPPSFEEQADAVIDKIKNATEADAKENSKIQIGYASPGQPMQTQVSRSRPTIEKRRNPSQAEYKIAGSIRLPTTGIALHPTDTLQIGRFEDGASKETALVDVASSKFELQVPDLTGAIVAQLLDSKGHVVAEGSQRISKYDIAQIQNLPSIELKPVQSSLSGVLTPFGASPLALTEKIQGREKGVKAKILYASFDSESTTDELGSFKFDQVLKGSWALMRTEARDYYPAIFMSEAGSDRKLPLFTQKMIEALKQITSDQKLISDVEENGSVVWGQITQDGKPLAGVQVDVEFLSDFHPIYFNNFLIPDPSLKSTGANGYFAILNLPSGFHSLVATRASQYFSHANVVVDQDAISIVEVSSSLKKDLVQLKVFDAFTGTAQGSKLEIQSLAHAIDVNGYASLDLPAISRMSLLNSEPFSDAYLSTIQIYNDSDDFIHVPLINKAWFESVKAAQKISYVPDTGNVIGFVENADYEVYLPHAENYSKDQIVFFDSQGQLSPTGVAGGGFILYNVPMGVQSVIVVNKDSDMISSHVVPSDVDSNIVLKITF